MPNYDQTGPAGQGQTGRRSQICQRNNQTNPDQQNNPGFSPFRNCFRANSANNQQGQGQGNGNRRGNKGNCRRRNRQ